MTTVIRRACLQVLSTFPPSLPQWSNTKKNAGKTAERNMKNLRTRTYISAISWDQTSHGANLHNSSASFVKCVSSCSNQIVSLLNALL